MGAYTIDRTNYDPLTGGDYTRGQVNGLIEALRARRHVYLDASNAWRHQGDDFGALWFEAYAEDCLRQINAIYSAANF